MLISILTAINLPLTSALNFTFSSPESVKLKEAFGVFINAPINESYDIKIVVLDENKTIISEVFNEGWKNPFFYIKEIFPEEKEFEIRLVKPGNNNTICVRLRKSGKNSFDERCNEIKLIGSFAGDENANEERDAEKEAPALKKDGREKDIEEEKAEEEIPAVIKEQPLPSGIGSVMAANYLSMDNSDKEIIKLNSVQIKDEDKFVTKNQIMRNWIFYSFIGLCLILIIILAMDRL